jgi:hypothetical protein
MFWKLIALPYYIVTRLRWTRKATPAQRRTYARIGSDGLTRSQRLRALKRIAERKRAEEATLRLSQEQSRIRWATEEREMQRLHEELPVTIDVEHRAEALARAKGEHHDAAA